jgi:hypothetical protein
MSGVENGYHEQMEAGLLPHSVLERYYFVGRPGQPCNRAVDITAHIEKKIDSIVECRPQGGGSLGSQLRPRLAQCGGGLTQR